MNKQVPDPALDGDEDAVDGAQAPATPAETRQAGLDLAVRRYAVYRKILVQYRADPRPSTLGTMTRERRHRALVLYLLLVAWWPWLQTQRVPLSGDTWIRALTATGPARSKALTWSPSTLSRAWADLEALNLIEARKREGRFTRVIPRREDGAEPYAPPSGVKGNRDDEYFTIPDAFWTEEYFATLSLPALAALLIIAKETTQKKSIWLPRASMTDWYGISGRTIQTGIAELKAINLVKDYTSVVPAPLSPNGITRRVEYSLTGDFGGEARRAQQKKASTAQRQKHDPSPSAADQPRGPRTLRLADFITEGR